MTTASTNDLGGLVDYVWTRLLHRVEGLTDAEYMWEPVPRCWTLRTGADGRLRPDQAFPPPDPAPVTTIAWIVTHIAGTAPATDGLWPLVVGDRPPTPTPSRPPATAAEAVERIAAAGRGWRDAVESIPAGTLTATLGDLGDGDLARQFAGGAYAGSSVAALVLHAVDEHIHHGSQIATLRDLYRHTPDKQGYSSPSHDDPLIDAVLRGADEPNDSGTDPDAVGRAKADHPDAVAYAVTIGGLPAVERLLALGFPIDPDRADQPSPLHLAASCGDPEMVELLVGHGADTAAIDPFFGATPLDWARYFAQTAVVDVLRQR